MRQREPIFPENTGEVNAELERTIRLFIGRGLRMMELKERIRELEKKETRQ
jgi:hypothetical protein